MTYIANSSHFCTFRLWYLELSDHIWKVSSHFLFKFSVFQFIFLKFLIVQFAFSLIKLCGDVESNPGPRNKANKCRLLYSNVRGLYSNLNELQACSAQYDIILCSETLVSNRRNIAELLLPNFNRPALLLRDSRPRARGLAVYIRTGFCASMQKNHICECHEIQLVKITSRTNNFYIFSMYRNPDLDNSIFDCLLDSMFEIQGADRKASFIFVGDLNVHHQNWLVSVSNTDSAGIAALDFANLSGCDQLVQESTHRSGNCLDLLLTDVPQVVDVKVKPPLGTSDHCIVSFNLKLTFQIPDIRFERRVYLKERTDWCAVLRDVQSIRWGSIFRSPNPVDLLNDELVNIINRRVPQKIIRTRSKDKCWFNEDCRRALNDKQQAYHRWSRDKSDNHWREYIRLRSIAARAYNTAQDEFNSSLQDSLANATQSHKWWSTLKTALFGVDSSLPPLRGNHGDLIFEPKAKAELLSECFLSKQSDWEPNLPDTCHPEPKITNIIFRSSLLRKYLNDLDSHGGVDPNGIFPLFLKKISNLLAPKLARIFRILIRLGSFPKVWRTANVTPIPKGTSPSPFPIEYRPISLTPILSKIYERLIFERLYKYVDTNHLLPSTQFGFRKGLGTTDALLTFVHEVQSSLDSRSETRAISLDFSSAFDLVNHKSLLYKLESRGVGGKILNILMEFLCARQQRVGVDGQFSEFRSTLSGVPQGSVLGPLLFILFSSDMWVGLENRLMAYADDATLYTIIDRPANRIAVGNSLNKDLERIHKWCTIWGMRLNPRKTQSIIFSRSRTLHPNHPPLSLCGSSIPVSDSIKLLGVTLDDKLTFERHIRQLSSSVAQKTGLLRKCFKTFGNREALTRSFFAFILPCFEYCSPVWSSAALSHLRLLDRAFNGIRFFIPDLSINLHERREVASLVFFFKIFNNNNHPMHFHLPPPYIPRRVTRFANAVNDAAFQFVRFNTTQYSRCFLPYICKIWNELPNDVVSVADSVKFKSAVKHHYSTVRVP